MFSLHAGTRVAAEQDGFPERLLCPSDCGGVDCRHRRKVGGLWPGLHGPSLVALTAETACGAPACLGAMIIFCGRSEAEGPSHHRWAALLCGACRCSPAK